MKKKLLIVTQKVDRNDPILGFFHSWIREFATHFESITVIALGTGQYELPTNVKVLSLGKKSQESGDMSQEKNHDSCLLSHDSKSTKFRYLTKFLSYIWNERSNYDTVFVHMNPIYVAIGGILWKTWGKKVSLWYTHRNVDAKLRIAELFTDIIFTASKESFQLDSKKVMVVGHGIDVESYANAPHKMIGAEPIKILCVGRITPIKNQLVLAQAAKILKHSWKKKFEIECVGTPAKNGDDGYEKSVREYVRANDLTDYFKFVGDVIPERMPLKLSHADLSVNLTPTGGVDKVVLEAMASGTLVMSSNEAFKNYFGPHADRLLFKLKDSSDLADKIMNLFNSSDFQTIARTLQTTVREKSDIQKLIAGISDNLKA